MIKIKVYTILSIKKIVGQREFEVSIRTDSTVKDLLLWMIQQWGETLTPLVFQPGSDRLLPHIRLIVNGRDIQFLNGVETVLHDGDEFSMIPILTGG